MNKVKWGIIGPGKVAHRFADGLKEASSGILVSIASKTQDHLLLFGEKYNIDPALRFKNYDEIIQSSEVDAIYISTPHTLHAEWTIKAASNGKHVLCEKPGAVNYKEGKNGELTIKQLLTMSSGINFDEDYANPFAYPAKAYYGTDLKKLTDNYEVKEEPSKVFKYLSGNTQILQQLLAKATGMTVSDYASQKLWGPIGAQNDAYWNLDHEGGDEKSYCCISSI